MGSSYSITLQFLLVGDHQVVNEVLYLQGLQDLNWCVTFLMFWGQTNGDEQIRLTNYWY